MTLIEQIEQAQQRHGAIAGLRKELVAEQCEKLRAEAVDMYLKQLLRAATNLSKVATMDNSGRAVVERRYPEIDRIYQRLGLLISSINP
jgi:hypothetical protein